MHHKKYPFVKHLVSCNQPICLMGPAGTGKTTMCKQVAQDLGLEFSAIPITKQTSKGDFLGFISISGEYIPSQFRKAVEFGHLFLLDEIDAADPNTILLLNSLENGYVGFPDKVVQVHENFRLVATANPSSEHASYTGRSKLDYSTLDRFLPIQIDRDDDLETALTSQDTVDTVNVIREFLTQRGGSIQATMRDTIRIHKLIENNITEEDPFEVVIFVKEPELVAPYREHMKQAEELIKQKRIEAERKAKEAEEKRIYEAKSQAEVSTYSEYVDKIKKGK